MAIENTVSNDFFYLRSSIVLTFSIVACLVITHYITSHRKANELSIHKTSDPLLGRRKNVKKKQIYCNFFSMLLLLGRV